MMVELVLVTLALAASAGLTWLLRRYALAASLMDIPNDRSSHALPTPRGGGVAFVVVFLLGLLALFSCNLLSLQTLAALWPACAVVAVVGFMDDHQHIPARWRLLAHFTAAGFGLYALDGFAPLDFSASGEWVLNLGWVGNGLALFYLVWMLNLYNFMDGIDGLAGIEAICVCTGAALLSVLGLDLSDFHLQLLLLAAAVAGFLLWNFPPAKIFMGDAGSGFLGLVLGLMSLEAAWQSPKFFWSWLILLAVFIVDATFTLLHRLLRREKVYEAHRSHAYQRASRIYGAHKPVSLAVLTINIVWLMPLALWVGLGNLNGVLGFVVACLPLVWLAIKFKAGARD